jgi:hypothetical protein
LPLFIPESPINSQTAAQDGLRRLSGRSERFASILGGGAPPELSRPHRVYTFGISDLLAGVNLEDAKIAGWRYLVTPSSGGPPPSQSRPVAEVSDVGGAPHFASYHEGWLGDLTDKAIDAVEQMPAVENGNFELRMLRIPAIKVDSLWLKSQNQSPDLIFVVASDAAEIEAQTLYDASNFMGLAKQAASRLKSDDNSPETLRANIR